MKKIISGVLTLLVFSFLAISSPVLASNATLTLSATGDGDSVALNVSGNANSSVILYYFKNGTAQAVFLGNTNASGSFSTTLSTIAYNVSPNSLVHVLIGGLSGSQSSDVAWPYVSASNLALDKTSIVLPLGQSTTITAYNNGTSLIYLSSNSSPITANVNISGSQINIKANNYGSTVINICAQSNTGSCASAYINVQNTGATPLAFSQSSVGLVSGQNTNVNIYGGNNSYSLINNSNSNAVTASLSGSTIVLTANNNSGYSAITICSSDLSACGIINASIGSGAGTALSFGQPNPTLSVGQNASINISGGGSSSYSILSNSNSSVTSANISGSSLSLNALTGGSSTVIVCSSLGSCSSLTATVIGSNSSSGTISLGQNNLWLSAGQSFSLTISGGATPYSVLSDNSNIATASINNSILTINGINAGSAGINVCSAGGGCVNLAVLVNGVGVNTTTNITLSPSQVSLNSTSTNATINILGNGSYFISGNTNSSVANTLISGSQVIIAPLSAGNTTISVCQNGGQCANLLVSVNITTNNTSVNTSVDSNTSSPETNTSLPDTVSNGTLVRSPEGKIYFITNNAKKYVSSVKELKNNYAGLKLKNISKEIIDQIPNASATYKFSGILSLGNSGPAVLELQKRLQALNLYKGSLDSHFTATLVTAVRKYQKNNNIRQTGNVGPLTADNLNK